MAEEITTNRSCMDDQSKQTPNGDEDNNARDSPTPSSSMTPAASAAEMPVDGVQYYYNMRHNNRGEAIIFNHEHFECDQPSRPGTNVDCDNLAEVLEDLGFYVTIYTDLRAEDVIRYIQNISEMDHSDNDCLLIVVLTHGHLDMLYANDTHYKPANLWYWFTEDKCPTLAGKPKLFFIQACGGNFDDGITLTKRTETDGSSSDSYRIPYHPDFLIVFPTPPSFYAWRNTTLGTWFMQALCEELKYTAAERDILTLLTFVSQRVALDYESNTPKSPDMHQKKEIPCITTTLTRLLVFGKK